MAAALFPNSSRVSPLGVWTLCAVFARLDVCYWLYSYQTHAVLFYEDVIFVTAVIRHFALLIVMFNPKAGLFDVTSTCRRTLSEEFYLIQAEFHLFFNPSSSGITIFDDILLQSLKVDVLIFYTDCKARFAGTRTRERALNSSQSNFSEMFVLYSPVLLLNKYWTGRTRVFKYELLKSTSC